MSALSSKSLFDFMEFLRSKFSSGVNRFVITFHYLEPGETTKISHHFLTNDFPKADLIQCAQALEKKSVSILKGE